MQRTINGYAYDLPNVEDVRETVPGHWEGRTKEGEPFFILGGTRLKGARDQWYAVSPSAFGGPAPVPAHSLAEGLRKVDAALAPSAEPEVKRARQRRSGTLKLKNAA